MIEIDGSYGEGGGQLVRTAVALAAVSGTAVRVRNVRARRRKPGLGSQHLTALRAVAALCGARTEGLELGSGAVAFFPGAVRPGSYRFEVGTAGSVTLVLQALLPPLLAARVRARVEVSGGTDVRQAPPAGYVEAVLLRQLERMGARVRLEVARRGYYPRGGGEVALEVEPAGLRPLECTAPGRLCALRGEAHVANLPVHIAERMRAAGLAALAGCDAQPQIAVRRLGEREAFGRGGAIVLWPETEHTVLGAARVAELGVRAETLGEAVARELRADLAAGVTADVHAADQLLVYLALARGRSAFTTREFTSHARTAMWIIEQFLPVRFCAEPVAGAVRVAVAS